MLSAGDDQRSSRYRRLRRHRQGDGAPPGEHGAAYGLRATRRIGRTRSQRRSSPPGQALPVVDEVRSGSNGDPGRAASSDSGA